MTSPVEPSEAGAPQGASAAPPSASAQPPASFRSVWLERALWAAACLVLLRLAWPSHDSPLLGQAAPSLNLPSLTSAQLVSLNTRAGKPLLIEVFASWCGACKRSSGMLGSLGEAQRQGQLEVVAVSVDDDPEDALAAARSWPIQVPLAHDRRGALRRAYDVRVLPTFILIDKSGHISDVTTGVPGALDMRRWLNASEP